MLQQDIHGNNLPSWYGGAYAPADMSNPYWRQYTRLCVRLALESGRGRRSVPLHGALIGTALSVAAITAAVTFGANLVHLKETPRLYGQTWDAAVDLQFGVITAQHFGEIAAHVPGVTGWTFGLHGTVTIDHAVVPAIGLAPGRGPILTPTILTGHPMAGRGQLVLGTLLLRHDRIKLGQRIRISASGRPGVARVVGSAIFPYFGQGSFTPTDLGQGAIVPASLLAAEATEANGPGFNFVLLTFASGPGKAADLAAFRRAIAPFCASVQQSTCVLTRQQPNGVTTFARVDATPEILAGLLAVIGLGVLAQFSFQSARFRRRDFAVLRTLGLGRRQLTAVTAWQISTLAVLALLLGEPAGSAAGRAAWAIFARQLGISPATVVPLGTVLILIPAVLLAANLVAAWPGRRTARVSPAELLRAE
jgi:hypothetical protein